MQTYVHTMYTYVHVRVCDRTVITYSWAGNMQRNESFELPQPRRSRYVGFPSLLLFYTLLKAGDILSQTVFKYMQH